MTQDLTFCCPHCNHRYDDDLELLGSKELHEFRCENCTKSFQMAIEECLSCNAETVFVWSTAPSAAERLHLSCETCAKSLNVPETLVKELH